MPQRRTRPGWIAVLSLIALASSGCGTTDQQLQRQRDNLDSLGASAAAIGDAWLAGSISGTFTATALEQVSLLLEQQRHALAEAPQMLLDPRGVELSQASEKFARLLAAMIHDVRGANARAVREHLSKLPSDSPDSR